METYSAFSSTAAGILLCTDVGARGLDMPSVDWVLQYDVPADPREYVHRAGRSARGGGSGSAMLFLMPSESGYAEFLSKTVGTLREAALVPFYDAGIGGEANAPLLQAMCFDMVANSDELAASARAAFTAYVRSYAVRSRETRPLCPISALHLGHVAATFGLRESPSRVVELLKVGRKEKAALLKNSRQGVDKKKQNKSSASRR